MGTQPPGAASDQQALHSTHVVTSFLMRTDMAEPRILLVQRSQRVGTYHAQWAGISGFVEPDTTPEEQAYREICEETGLQHEQVRLLKRGAVVELVDPSVGRHWYIHPFLFEVLAPEAIHTDWEAMAMRWIAPAELTSYDTVPKLLEVYEAAVHGTV